MRFGGLKIVRRNVRISLIAIGVLWLVFVIMRIPVFPNPVYFGIQPRRLAGLLGILTYPLIHGGLVHLVANSVALLVLLVISLSYSRELTLDVVVVSWLFSGVFIWLLGRSGFHVGASGIVFGLIGFLTLAGFFRRDWRAIVVSVIILIFYGGAWRSLLWVQGGISWTGHFSGLLAGVLTAWATRKDKR